MNKEWAHEVIAKVFDDGGEEWFLEKVDEVVDENDPFIVVQESPGDLEVMGYNTKEQAEADITEQMEYGDSGAYGGRGGPDNDSRFLLLDMKACQAYTPVRGSIAFEVYP